MIAALSQWQKKKNGRESGTFVKCFVILPGAPSTGVILVLVDNFGPANEKTICYI